MSPVPRVLTPPPPASDDLLKVDPFQRLSERLRKFCGQFTLLLSGIVYDVHGLDRAHETFAAPCVVFAFTHASNLDGLLISASSPVRHYALAKKEVCAVCASGSLCPPLLMR